jgi:hypothetical protein
LIKRRAIVRFDPYPLNTSGILHFSESAICFVFLRSFYFTYL